jgi:hypothetical protein
MAPFSMKKGPAKRKQSGASEALDLTNREERTKGG